MSQWFYPARSASEGPWDVSLGATGSTVEVDGWAHTGIKVASIEAGKVLALPSAAEERLFVPLSGGPVSIDVTDGETYALRGRADVFAGPSDVAYVGPGRAVTITAESAVRLAVATAPATGPVEDRLILAEEVPVGLRGQGTCSREVHELGMAGTLQAEKFLVCEVITPAGNWSSFPPHKHDEITETENSLEEIYYFEIRPAQGAPASADEPMGLARAYSTDVQRSLEVTEQVDSGDTLLIPYGWHGPMAAAPGYDMYYLNIMAGPGAREWLVTNDPQHEWIPATLADQPVDPRLPLKRV